MAELRIKTLGIETRAWEYGSPDGETIILVHGFRGDHHGLEGLAVAIAKSHPEKRVIVPDLPGFGATPAIHEKKHTLELFGDWLRAFADAVAPDGHVILGHSFGSLVVSQALSDGLSPSRTVLINPISAPALEGPQAMLTKLAIAYYRVAEAFPERPARMLLGHPLIVRTMSAVMAKTRDPQLRRWIHAQHDAYFSVFSDTATLSQAFRASVSHTVTEFSTSYDMPTLIIAGERDDIAPLTAQLALHRIIKHSRLVVLPGVGHLVHYEAVDDALAEIGLFVSESIGKR